MKSIFNSIIMAVLIYLMSTAISCEKMLEVELPDNQMLSPTPSAMLMSDHQLKGRGADAKLDVRSGGDGAADGLGRSGNRACEPGSLGG